MTPPRRPSWHLWMTLIAPVAAIGVSVAVALEEGRHHGARVQHTEIRKNFFSKGIILLAANVLIAVVAAEFVLPAWPKTGVALVVAGIIGIAASVTCISLLVAQQSAWKGYWCDRLLEVMAVAERDGTMISSIGR